MNQNIFLCFLGAIGMFLFFTSCNGMPLKKGASEKSQQKHKVAETIFPNEEKTEPEAVPFKLFHKDSALTELEKKLYEIMEKYRIAGMQAAVIKEDSIVWKGALGWFDIQKEIPLQNDHMIRIASISKSFVGLSAMTLVQEGKLNLDEDINTYLDLPVTIRNPHHPEVPITPRHLMNHTSSISNGQYLEYVVASRNQNPVTITLADYFGENGEFNKPENWAETMPGEKFSYSNMGTVVLGAVIEKLSGMEFNLYVQESVLKPLGMRNSSFNSVDLDPDRTALMYRRKEENEQVSFTWTPVPVSGNFQGYVPGSNGGLSSPQGGLISTALDLSKFVIAMTNRGKSGDAQLFSRDIIELMHRKSVDITSEEESPKELYKKKGLCIHITEDIIPGYTFYGHAGSAYGIIGHMYYTLDLPENFGFVMLFNGCNITKRQDHPFYSIEEDLVRLFYDKFIAQK